MNNATDSEAAVYTVNAAKPASDCSFGSALATATDANGPIVLETAAVGTAPGADGKIAVSAPGSIVAGTYSVQILTTDNKGGTTISNVSIIIGAADTEAVYPVNPAEPRNDYVNNKVPASVSDLNGAITAACRPACCRLALKVDNIYYDFNKATIRPDTAREPDKLADVMWKYPDMRIGLRSRTDNRSSSSSTLQLSAKRAQAAVEYVTTKGIIPSRRRAAGYGESLPPSNCTDGATCTEEAYQHHRRTAFKALSSNNSALVTICSYHGRWRGPPALTYGMEI